jgi:hypothetical protein
MEPDRKVHYRDNNSAPLDLTLSQFTNSHPISPKPISVLFPHLRLSDVAQSV